MIDTLIRLLAALRSDKKNTYLYRSGWDLGDSGTSLGINSYVAYTNSNGAIQAIGPDTGITQAGTKKMDERIEKKPVEVFKELLAETPKMDLNDLEGQIKLVTKRHKMLEELGVNTSDEREALGFLGARKKGMKIKVDFRWAPTTFALIEELLKKYKLSMVSFESYARNVPMEAIDELEDFLAEYKKV